MGRLQTTGMVVAFTALSFAFGEQAFAEETLSDTIEQFLFDTKRGHCEYFASALAAMCHSVGVQARVITGYVAYEFDPGGQEYIVSESNAHAWVEVRTDDWSWIGLLRRLCRDTQYQLLSGIYSMLVGKRIYFEKLPLIDPGPFRDRTDCIARLDYIRIGALGYCYRRRTPAVWKIYCLAYPNPVATPQIIQRDKFRDARPIPRRDGRQAVPALYFVLQVRRLSSETLIVGDCSQNLHRRSIVWIIR